MTPGAGPRLRAGALLARPQASNACRTVLTTRRQSVSDVMLKRGIERSALLFNALLRILRPSSISVGETRAGLECFFVTPDHLPDLFHTNRPDSASKFLLSDN